MEQRPNKRMQLRMSEASSALGVYRSFLEGNVTLDEAVAVLSAQAQSGSVASGTLALDGVTLGGLTQTERQRIGELLSKVLGPISRALANGELSADAAARQLAPFTPSHSFFALEGLAPDGSPWSPEAVTRFSQLFERLAELSR